MPFRSKRALGTGTGSFKIWKFSQPQVRVSSSSAFDVYAPRERLARYNKTKPAQSYPF